MVHRPSLMAAAVVVVAAAEPRMSCGVGGTGGDDRGSIYRNGDLYIARRGLCIASTHPAQSPPGPPPTADPRRRERTAPHCEHSRVGSWGCAGVAAGLRGPPYGTEVLYAVQAGSMKPGHTIPSAQGARDFSYVEMHPPFSSPFSRHVRAREADGCDGVSVAARGDAADVVTAASNSIHQMLHSGITKNRPGFREKRRKFIQFFSWEIF